MTLTSLRKALAPASSMLAPMSGAWLVSLACAQVEWTLRVAGPAVSRCPLVFDEARGRMMTFGGASPLPTGFSDETCEWTGTRWNRRPPLSNPPARGGHALAYDSVRQRVVMFGGFFHTGGPTTTLFDDTWEWDGSNWVQRTPTTRPAARHNHAMAFDRQRGRVVLFGGGMNVFSLFADTWEWDGTTWSLRSPLTAMPSARMYHAMAYDDGKRRCVMFGGQVTSTLHPQLHLDDTWEWDGSRWTLRQGAAPPAQRGAAMAYDPQRQRIVLLDATPSGATSRTWELNGNNWAVLATPHEPPQREMASMAWDDVRRRLVLYGGTATSTEYEDTWELAGQTGWSQVHPGRPRNPSGDQSLVYDERRGRCVMLVRVQGGPAQTWEWSGADWQLRTSLHVPPSREYHRMAYDSQRGRTVLFGGRSGSTLLGDTWEWDGVDWIQMNTVDVLVGSDSLVSPPPQDRHALASDTCRGRIVLFGLGQTWEWDGARWLLRAPVTSPPAISGHAMAYDAGRDRVVLFCGSTWEWDGSDWSMCSPTNSPPSQQGHSMAYDSMRARTVLFGGRVWSGTGVAMLEDTWEWDGHDWVMRLAGSGPQSSGSVAFDTARGCVVLFDTGTRIWEYATREPAAYVAFGQGCSGTSGTPTLAATWPDLPWMGGSFRVSIGNVPTGALTVMLTGFSSSIWGSRSLPFDLTPLGAPCTLYTSIDLSQLLPESNGGAEWSAPIPTDASILGTSFYNQAFVLDPGANPLGLAASNAATGTIGAR